MNNAKTDTQAETDIPTLLAEIAHDTGTLVGQHLTLLRAEVTQELHRAGSGLVSLAAGTGLTAAGGLLAGMTLAHLLHRSTRLPLWICLGTVGGGLGVTGLALVRRGGGHIAGIKLIPPPQTAAATKENLEWAKEKLMP